MIFNYRCPSGPRNVVAFYQNEHKSLLPKCTTNPCTLENLKQNFEDVFDEDKCNLKFCHESETLKASSGCSIYFNSSVMIICGIVGYFM